MLQGETAPRLKEELILEELRERLIESHISILLYSFPFNSVRVLHGLVRSEREKFSPVTFAFRIFIGNRFGITFFRPFHFPHNAARFGIHVDKLVILKCCWVTHADQEKRRGSSGSLGGGGGGGGGLSSCFSIGRSNGGSLP